MKNTSENYYSRKNNNQNKKNLNSNSYSKNTNSPIKNKRNFINSDKNKSVNSLNEIDKNKSKFSSLNRRNSRTNSAK